MVFENNIGSLYDLHGAGHQLVEEALQSQIINVDNWKNMKYVVWASAVALAQLGYFVPYVHIVRSFDY